MTAQEETAAQISWDLVVFEEANILSTVYQEQNKQAKVLDHIAGSAFRLLLTGTPIEKNIMDLYGLIWFIDQTVLPEPQAFLTRYLRKPENYPELAERVSKFCFRTLRSQAKQYAKIPERVLLTDEYLFSDQEKALYEALEKYICQPHKKAFPEMNQYDLALRLFALQSSSTSAILQTIQGVIKRLEMMGNAKEELIQWQNIKQLAEVIPQDTKETELLLALKKGFAVLKKYGAKKKAIIFTESIATLNRLVQLLSEQYITYAYYGKAEATVIEQFRQNGEILISTDSGAKGFHLAQASFVIHYDLPYNTLKMEQRIDRCHRLQILQKPTNYTETKPVAHWLKSTGRKHLLDNIVPIAQLLEQQAEKISPAQQEELENIKLSVKRKKATLKHTLHALEIEEKNVQQQLTQATGDRLKRILLEKQVTKLHQEVMKKQENLFFAQMQLDMEMEEQLKQFYEKEKLTAKIQREFIVEVKP